MARNDEPSEVLLAHIEDVVRGGYLSRWEEVLAFVQRLVREQLERGTRTEPYVAHARRLFDAAVLEEARWTEPTVNDAIDRAFEELNRQGIVALQNAGGTRTQNWEAARKRDPAARGATWFSSQEVERAVRGEGLQLFFVAFVDTPDARGPASLAIAREVRETLARHGVETEWDRRVDSPLRIPPFPWRKRRPPATEESSGAFSCEEVLRQVVRETGASREEAIAALESFICDAVRQRYGTWRHLEAKYSPDGDFVEVFQVFRILEAGTSPGREENALALNWLGAPPGEVEPGDELVFQLFYRPEDSEAAQAQDEQYGHLVRQITFGHSVELKPGPVKAGLLERLRAARG
jgi:hypothetical protein